MDPIISLPFSKILRIIEVGFHHTAKGYIHPDRRLDWNVFFYVCEGQMQVCEEGSNYTVEKGQFLFLKAGLHHWGTLRTSAGTSWFWIHFHDHRHENADAVKTPSTEAGPAIPYHAYDRSVPLPKTGTCRNAPQTVKQLEGIVSLFSKPEAGMILKLSMCVTALFIDITHEHRNTGPQIKSDRTIQRILNFLKAKKSYPIRSKEMEQALQMNYSYLCYVFKKKTGLTISAYNSRIFVAKAITAMQESSKTITEISDALGFSNPFYFSRVFRNVMGCSPSEYRNTAHANDSPGFDSCLPF